MSEILCSTPGNIKNGRFTVYKDEYQYNEIVIYMCDPSNGPDEYSLVGESTLICVDYDRWSSDPPECKVVKCDYPVVEHGMILSGFRRKFYYKAQVVFKCNQGFYLHGSSTIVCNANSVWEPKLPTCTKAFRKTDTDDNATSSFRSTLPAQGVNSPFNKARPGGTSYFPQAAAASG
nr:PREDICTED: membrane cofactor protein [Bos mutus]